MDSVIGDAFVLAGLIGYQNGSVVSKELIRREKGSITLFAFDKEQGLSEHTAPFDAFVYVLDGTVEITIAGCPKILKAAEAVIMPANKPHSLRAIEKFKMLLVMIKS